MQSDNVTKSILQVKRVKQLMNYNNTQSSNESTGEHIRTSGRKGHKIIYQKILVNIICFPAILAKIMHYGRIVTKDEGQGENILYPY